jgi:hypothetical protein
MGNNKGTRRWGTRRWSEEEEANMQKDEEKIRRRGKIYS